MSMKFYSHGAGNYSIHKDNHKVGMILFKAPKKYSLEIEGLEPTICVSIRQAKYKAMWHFNDFNVRNYLYH